MDTYGNTLNKSIDIDDGLLLSIHVLEQGNEWVIHVWSCNLALLYVYTTIFVILILV